MIRKIWAAMGDFLWGIAIGITIMGLLEARPADSCNKASEALAEIATHPPLSTKPAEECIANIEGGFPECEFSARLPWPPSDNELEATK